LTASLCTPTPHTDFGAVSSSTNISQACYHSCVVVAEGSRHGKVSSQTVLGILPRYWQCRKGSRTPVWKPTSSFLPSGVASISTRGGRRTEYQPTSLPKRAARVSCRHAVRIFPRLSRKPRVSGAWGRLNANLSTVWIAQAHPGVAHLLVMHHRVVDLDVETKPLHR
jgi:hypothetical protein